ncbi:MAG TPA: UvrD-helicase domain-containing protein, partial [Blastocatellia bacterium]|nr:UvrD-helicase domain-containing protein [Blastocatellia bacterium]
MVVRRNEKLADEQASAAYTLDRHVSVTAGPGAGKTSVLVERYLHILRTADVSIDQIVAITFTNRAANEMRERLRRELGSLVAGAQGTERARWLHHKRRVEGAIITTIHGFCAALLKEYPVEAEVDPEFVLLDECQTAMLEEAAAEEVVSDAIASEDSSIIALVSGVGRPQLAEAMVVAYRTFRSYGKGHEDLARSTVENHAVRSRYDEALDQLEPAMRAFITRRGLTPSARSRQSAAVRQWPEMLDLLRAGPGSIPVSEFCRRLERFREEARPSASGDLAGISRDLDDLLFKADFAGQVPLMWFDQHAAKYALSMAAAIRGVEERLNEQKRQLSALDFDDLQLRVLDMFLRHPDTSRRVSGRFRFFLVDEFQDTNDVQRQLLEAIVLEQQNSKTGANLFIVGDRKQSVYGFRGADVKVFAETGRDIERLGGVALSLRLNFRSQPPLIHFFNHLFPGIFAAEAGLEEVELAELGYVEHEPGVPYRETEDPPPLAEILIDSGEGEENPERQPRERDARQIAWRMVQLAAGGRGELKNLPPVRRFKFGDIAILFRAMTEVPIYEAELRRAGIPYQTVQGKGFYDLQEISDLVQLLRFLENTTDDLALAALLRSPLGGVSDNALLALRLGPDEPEGSRETKKDWVSAGLLFAVRHHRDISIIDDPDRAALD